MILIRLMVFFLSFLIKDVVDTDWQLWKHPPNRLVKVDDPAVTFTNSSAARPTGNRKEPKDFEAFPVLLLEFYSVILIRRFTFSQKPSQEVDTLSDEDEAVASDLDLHALIVAHNPPDLEIEPLQSAEEVIKEIDDLMQVFPSPRHLLE